MGKGLNAAEERFKEIMSERREICLLRNEYSDIMKPIWDSFERNSKIRVDLEVDSDGELVLDDEGRPNDLTGNNYFESKSRSFFRFSRFSVLFQVFICQFRSFHFFVTSFFQKLL